MKINRLLETTIVLMNKGHTTARELAERFDVSVRTIYRDIDILSSAGVPVYCNRGAGGGISLLDNYALPKTIISKDEIDSILFSLQSLKVTKYPDIDRVMEKLGAVFKPSDHEWIEIDFTPWGSDPNQSDKLTDIKMAVLQGRMIEFDYISSANVRSHRQMEPLKLIFKAHSWYIWGWSVERQDYRTFRLSRIKKLEMLNISFDKSRLRVPVQPQLTDGNTPAEDDIDSNLVHLKLRFTDDSLYRLYDDYDDENLKIDDQGRYTVDFTFPEDEWVYGYILSFGSFVEVLSPPHIRKIILERASKMVQFYTEESVNE